MAAQGVFRWMQAYVVMLYCFTEALSAASESSRSYYATLSVEPSASDSHIKKAFRKLAIKYHPDKNKSADAEKTFGEIAEAYRVLSNKEKRKLYDFVGHEAFLNDEASVDQDHEHETMSFHFGFEDLFDDSPFVEEPFLHWTFAQDGEDENGLYNHYGVEDNGHSFYFADDEEEEDEYYY
ncbi:dnaJ homolog subfamily B member 9-like [Anarrhichthys ocellatus]|uniref:dnaJ homolog subfamily B member 9-like n=1 Tax=Anarrhichthys ocellatus TaxID=433405 RepID=UPI0012EE3933|nr:dnaJ homolog subfamily B member 9-like [Anarrhichthys ocellatus]